MAKTQTWTMSAPSCNANANTDPTPIKAAVGVPLDTELLFKFVNERQLRQNKRVIEELVDYYVEHTDKRALANYLLTWLDIDELLWPLMCKFPLRVIRELAQLPRATAQPAVELPKVSKSTTAGDKRVTPVRVSAEQKAVLQKQVLTFLASVPSARREQIRQAVPFPSTAHYARVMHEMLTQGLVKKARGASGMYALVGSSSSIEKSEGRQKEQLKAQLLVFLAANPGSGKKKIMASVSFPSLWIYKDVVHELLQEKRVKLSCAGGNGTYTASAAPSGRSENELIGKVVDFLRHTPNARRSQIEAAVEFPYVGQFSRTMRALRDDGVVVKKGASHDTHYVLQEAA